MGKYYSFQEILPGRLMYLDFEITSVRSNQPCRLFSKMYVMAAFLPYSRYLYGVFFRELLTSEGLIRMLDNCFAHIGGVPEVLELNKERLALATKDANRITTASSFRSFARERGFVMRFNHKGMSHFIKTVISNYAQKTIFMEDWIWEEGFADWLKDLNSKPQRLPAKIVPVERLELEQPFFQPIQDISINY